MKKHTSTKSGFTLIELLVVIAIIGLLASITLAGVSIARQKAQNAYILSEAHQIQIALELGSQSGGYPNPLAAAQSLYCIGAATCSNPLVPGATVSSQLTQGLVYPIVAKTSSSVGFFSPNVAEAATYSGYGMPKVTTTYPFVFQCSVATNPCPVANSWLWYIQINGSVTTWYAQQAGSGAAVNQYSY